MDVTTASAIAMAQNAICFASIFLFLSRNIQPVANTTSITAASATYPATVRLYVTSESSTIFVTKKFISFSYSVQSIFVLQLIFYACAISTFFPSNANP